MRFRIDDLQSSDVGIEFGAETAPEFECGKRNILIP